MSCLDTFIVRKCADKGSTISIELHQVYVVCTVEYKKVDRDCERTRHKCATQTEVYYTDTFFISTRYEKIKLYKKKKNEKGSHTK